MTTPENVPRFGPPPVGPPLTADEVADLPHGAEIIVVWGGGNGPHRYRIHHDRGEPHAVPLWAWGDGPDGPLWFYNPLDGISRVGPERWNNRVWKVER